MATYLIGDIQGCFQELQSLLTKVNFNPNQDHLYLAGDLVARGPDSLAVLRFIKSLGKHGHTVLGNHDLHLLAVNEGLAKCKEKDKTLAIFQAEDRDELLTWLRHQPLLIHSSLGFVLTHAGIPPAWHLRQAKSCAQEVESLLQSDDYFSLLENMYGDEPSEWSSSLSGMLRLRFIINGLTRMRFCEPNGNLHMNCKLPPTEVDNLVPWFKVKSRHEFKEKIVFGHWAALNGYSSDNIIGLDTGCVWGGKLSMLRWEDQTIFTQTKL